MSKQAIEMPASVPFQSRFTTVGAHRIHYVEQGQGEPVVFLHGNPTSSYVWRNVLPRLVQRTGRRCIALDLLGFGKSDKPDIEYSLSLHGEVVRGFIVNLDLKNVILVGEDWGGPLAAHYAVTSPQNVAGLAFMETFLWPMTWEVDFSPKFRTAFKLMRGPLGYFLVQVLNIMTRVLIPQHCPISRESLDYYIQSCPSVNSRRAMREFPKLIPIEGSPAESVAFFSELQAGLAVTAMPIVWLRATPGVVPTYEYPTSFIAFERFREKVPRMTVKNFGPGHHFLAEENPVRVTDLLAQWMKELTLPRSVPPAIKAAKKSEAALRGL